MNEVQVGRFSSLLHKALEMGEGSPTPTLAPELFAMLALEVDRPEWAWLKAEKLCMGYDSEAAGVGARSMIGLRNPTGSGVLAVIKEIGATFDAAYIILTQNLGNGAALAGFTAGGASAVCDFRAGVNGLGYESLPTCEIIADTAAIAGGAFMRIFPYGGLGSARMFHHIHPIVLPPNSAVIVVGPTDNLAMITSFVWTERKVEPMEMQDVNPRLR